MGISWVYLGDDLGIYGGYIRNILWDICISVGYLRHFLGHLQDIMRICVGYHDDICVISRGYLGDISEISEAFLGDVTRIL